MIMRSEVVLPAPLGPSRPKTAPSLIRKLKLLTAVSVSNRLVTPREPLHPSVNPSCLRNLEELTLRIFPQTALF